MKKIADFLLTLSGARPEVLARCPSERIKFQSLGWAILITSGMAAVSMWFALYSALGVNPVLALVVALAWGLVIMGIDRWLVTSMPTSGSRRGLVAIPRLLLAVLLGTLISTPLVLRIFQSEINSEIAVIKEQRAAAFIEMQQHSPVGQQVTYWRNDVGNLQKVIDSGGLVALNPAADPEVKSLTARQASENALEQKYYKQWQCQLYGGPDCKKGNGPLARASEQSYRQAAAQVATLTSEIQARENQLSATDAASTHVRLNQAKTELPAAQQQFAMATSRLDTLRLNFENQNEQTNGLLIRLQALTALSGNSFTLNAARLLLFLLFLVIECLPVTVKLLQQPGNYEAILEVEAEQELREARQAYRTRPKDTEHFGTAGPDPSNTAELRDLWRPDDPKMSSWPAEDGLGDRPGSGAPVPVPQEPDSADEHWRLDDQALRTMPDLDEVSAPVDSGSRSGGFELRYDTDER